MRGPQSPLAHALFRRDAGLIERRHAGMKRRRRPDDTGGERGAGAFAEPHAKVKERTLAHVIEGAPMTGFGRDMSEHAVVETGGIEAMK